jgi:hypothetical protein
MQAMTSWLAPRVNNPRFLLCLAAGLLAFVVQSGELGTADTMHRLQTTHWMWTSDPQVFPNEYPEFGLHGRAGRLYSWYGIGQSLLMLPADVVGTWIAQWPVFSQYGDDPAVRSIVASYSTNILVNVLAALVVFRLLRQLRFSIRESAAGVLAVLFCTTHLHYTQNMMENNYIFLLTLTGFSFQYEWLQTDNRRALGVGSAALGLNLLTRLTTGLDLMAAGLFVVLALVLDGAERAGDKPEPGRWRGVRRRLIGYCRVAAPVYLFFLLLDRAYQFFRFGSFTNTYVSIFAQEMRQRDPSLPANFPWSTPFAEGFLGPLVQPEKSIFLFDPLLVLTLILLALLWKRLAPGIRAFSVTTILLLLAYLCFYARYTFWAGDFAWGDRYVSTTVEMAAMLGVPLLMRYRKELGRTMWRVGCGLIAISLVVQLASLAFWLPLEIYQMETLGHPTFVIGLRCKNIVAFACGKMEAWGLNTEAMTQDAWDYVHITTWNFLPCLLARVGATGAWVVDLVFAMWWSGIGLLGWVLVRLRSVLIAS